MSLRGVTYIDIPAPNEKQKLFFRDEHKYVAYGGARGGGKSWAVRVNALLMAARHPGISQMIIRRSYPELYANHIKPFMQLLPKDSYKYNDTKKEIRLPNGSCIMFRYCASDKDLLNFQGTECDVMYIDEATQLSEEQFRVLSACVRGASNGMPKRCYITCNPGGVGHGWVKRLFIDRQYKSGERAEEYNFIQALVKDNRALMEAQPDYIAQLEALPPKLRKAWLEGAWDVHMGQFFEDFYDRGEHYLDRKYTHVIEPFEVPESWRVYRSFDWGYNRPFSCGWWAVDFDGVVYRILEMYGCTGSPNEGVRWTPDRVFAQIARTEREHRWLRGRRIGGVADPAIWDAETGESIAECAARHGIYFTKGDHARIPGWMQLHYRLSFDENGYPMMYVFKNCRAFIRTLPLLQYDQQRPEDLDSSGEDHIADETRYFLMSRPIKPRSLKNEDNRTGLKLLLDIDQGELSAPGKLHRMEIIYE